MLITEQHVYAVSGKYWLVLVHKCDCTNLRCHPTSRMLPVIMSSVPNRVAEIDGVTSAAMINETTLVLVTSAEWSVIEDAALDVLQSAPDRIRDLAALVTDKYSGEEKYIPKNKYNDSGVPKNNNPYPPDDLRISKEWPPNDNYNR